jgi:DUF4097 and DUF4098 domain-containing protein YvlB
MEIWTFLEGDRVWIRDSRILEVLGSHSMINLKLLVPKRTTIKGWISNRVRAKDIEANMVISTSGSFSAENVTGDLWVDNRSGDLRIVDLDGKAEVEALSGNIYVENSRADLTIRSVLGNVTCDRLSGACKAKLIQGCLTMTDTCTSRLDLSTKDGRIVFDGIVMSGMGYNIKSESGDVEISLDYRSDCGLIAESEEGNVTSTLDRSGHSGKRRSGRSIHQNVRRGSGGMHVMSKTGNITIQPKEGKEDPS